MSALVGENGILSKASRSSTTQRLATYSEEFQMERGSEDIKSYADNLTASDSEIYAIDEDVKKYIPSLRDDDVGKVVIFEGKLVYTGEDLSDTDKEAAESLGYLDMSREDYEYMLGLRYLENAVKFHSNDATKIGVALGTGANPFETIAGINYGLGWYKITSAEELTNLGLSANEQKLLLEKTYSDKGYIVKYSNGAVQCITGKKMYAGLSNEIWKYTFNYKGETNGFVVSNLLSGVTKDSTKTETKFGNLVPTHTYASTGTTEGVIENYYKDKYNYDAEGGLILTTTTNIAIDSISPETNIKNEFTFSTTIKANLSQKGFPTNGGGCIAAISSTMSKWTMVLTVMNNNRLGFISYHDQHQYNTALSSIVNVSKTGIIADGYGVTDVSKYNEKYLNIIITAKKGEKMNLYLNGKLVSSMNAGNSDFSYDSITLGDLRPGRGFKYVGTIYNYALYGSVLNEDEIAQNWNYVKNELGIDENGDKIK